MSVVTLFSPAKLNLFLAIVGKRADGFHDLVSLVAPLDFGDWLRVETVEGSEIRLTCDEPSLPVDETNLVVKAARAFRSATGWSQGVSLRLNKRTPQGAGLGGGSSNATTTLLALNGLAGSPLGPAELSKLAAGLGSDCPLFLEKSPVVMRGRGERVEALPEAAVARLRGRKVWIFKPPFSVATAWAYARLAAMTGAYFPVSEAEAWLSRWLENPTAPLDDLLYNTLEAAVFSKYIALPAMLEQLRDDFGLAARMSGSGSACYALVPADWSAERSECAKAGIRASWGSGTFFVEAALA